MSKNIVNIPCGDGSYQPLCCRKKENGKYEFVLCHDFNDIGADPVTPPEPYLDGEEFDDVDFFPVFDPKGNDVTYVTVRKGDEKRLYCYMSMRFGKKHGFMLRPNNDLDLVFDPNKDAGRDFRLITDISKNIGDIL